MKVNNNIYTKLLFLIFLSMIFLLFSNILYLSVTGKHLVSGRDISAYGDTQGEKEEKRYANRGKIYTYDGELIAENKTVYELQAYIDKNRPAYPGQIAYVDEPERAAEQIAPILGTTKEYLYDRLTTEGVSQVLFGNAGANLTAIQKRQIEELELNGFEFTAHSKRMYYFNHFSSYVIGYARTSAENREVILGELGLELIWNDVLTGKDGSVVYLTNSSRTYSLPNSVIYEKEAVDGKDIYLTFDSNLQKLLEIRLESFIEESGADRVWCGVMEAKTGRMLALSSWPDYNLNELVIDNYTNYFFDYTYEPGSVIKPFVYAEAIDQGVYQGDALYQSGNIEVSGLVVNDWNSGKGWGQISYDEGLIRSSNVAIVSLIRDRMNREQYINTFNELGFFDEYEMDRFTTAAGWNNAGTSIIDDVSMGFGQSATFTPIQMLRAYSVFANDGRMVDPYIIDRIIEPDGNIYYSSKTNISEKIYSTEAVEYVNNLLEQSISSWYGTGTPYSMENVLVMGKTGTGQVADNVNGGFLLNKFSYTFVGLAPADDPQIVIIIGTQSSRDDFMSRKMGEVVKYMIDLSLSTLNYSNNQVLIDVKELNLVSYINQSVKFSQQQLNNSGFKTEILGNGNTVIGQFPRAGSLVSNTDTIFLLSDADSYVMPDMTGWSRKNALNYLSLLNVVVEYRNDASNVTSQSLAAGELVIPGSLIVLNE